MCTLPGTELTPGRSESAFPRRGHKPIAPARRRSPRSPDGRTFPPVQRLDAPRLVEQINAAYDLRLRYAGSASGGNVGAGYVTDPAGRRSVLTWQPGSRAEPHRGIADLLDIARTRGVPAPRYEHVLQVGDAVALIQQLLPGAAPTQVTTPGLVDQLVELNRRLRGALSDSPLPPTPLYLTESGPGFCIHETLAAFSDRTRRLLDWVREVGAASGTTMYGSDLVHLDYQPANVLVTGDAITGSSIGMAPAAVTAGSTSSCSISDYIRTTPTGASIKT